MTTIPSDEVLIIAVTSLRDAHPSLGIAKLLQQLKTDHPDWAVSEKRLRKVMSTSSAATTSLATAGVSQTNDEPGLIAVTGLDTTLKVTEIAPKVKARLFGGEKGKGLVAREKILEGEVIWQEEPWIVTADSELYAPLLQQQMCSQCFTVFPVRNPPLSISCAHCDMAHFCNRLCRSKAGVTAAHHDLLCPGQNKAALELLLYIHKTAGRHLEAAAKIIAKWRGEREWGADGQAEEVEKRVWEGTARVSLEKKEMERKEWEYVGEPRREEWKTAHSLVLKALNPSPADKGYKQFQKLLTRHRHSQPIPLTEKEAQRWFSFESFLELLGLGSINQEDSGGLYALHAHINHSCEPNVSARNLPKTFTPPSPASLPCSPPPPNSQGVRGTNKLTIIARRTIHPGEELTLPYVNFHLDREDRRRMLRELYGFWCSCPKCQREASKETKAAPATAAISAESANGRKEESANEEKQVM